MLRVHSRGTFLSEISSVGRQSLNSTGIFVILVPILYCQGIGLGFVYVENTIHRRDFKYGSEGRLQVAEAKTALGTVKVQAHGSERPCIRVDGLSATKRELVS
jgi:hypothetical protein